MCRIPIHSSYSGSYLLFVVTRYLSTLLSIFKIIVSQMLSHISSNCVNSRCKQKHNKIMQMCQFSIEMWHFDTDSDSNSYHSSVEIEMKLMKLATVEKYHQN